jgi:mono/diheme cytochrome c family protein
MPRTGNQAIGGSSRHWTSRRALGLITSCGVLSVAVLFAACAGVSDSGTQFDTLATVEARRNQPPPAMPSPDPDTDTDDPAVLAAAGRQLWSTFGCQGCHSVDGSPAAGPTWSGLWMSDVPLEDGTTVVADEDYIAESILEPGAKVHRGFPNIMPSYQGQMDETQIQAIIEFIKTLE